MIEAWRELLGRVFGLGRQTWVSRGVCPSARMVVAFSMLPLCHAFADGFCLRDHEQIVILGDSLTEGEDPDGFVNTTWRLRMRFHQDVVALRPDAAVLWLVNLEDFQPAHRMSLTDVESHLARIARLAQGSGIRLGVGSVLPGCGSSGKACQVDPKLVRRARKLND